jgi:hypothetical protein
VVAGVVPVVVVSSFGVVLPVGLVVITAKEGTSVYVMKESTSS